jgi:hypothetical protein
VNSMMRLSTIAICVLLSGCYAHQQIPLAQLEHLTAVPGRPSATDVPGEDCGGCTVNVDTTTPLLLTDISGRVHRLTPFFFHMSDKQVVSPDYGVLVARADIQRAEVRDLSLGGTLTVVILVAAAAVGTFLGIQLTAGEERLGRAAQ